MQSCMLYGKLIREPKQSYIVYEKEKDGETVQETFAKCDSKILVSDYIGNGKYHFSHFQVSAFCALADIMSRFSQDDFVVVKGEFRNTSYRDGNYTLIPAVYFRVKEIERVREVRTQPVGASEQDAKAEECISYMMEHGIPLLEQSFLD